MKQVVIENPVLNSPFREPTRHFRFTDEGISNEIDDGRRRSSYFAPIARPKKKGKQRALFRNRVDPVPHRRKPVRQRSPVPTNLLTNSNAPFAPRSTKLPGRAFTAPKAVCSISPRPAKSPSRSSTTMATRSLGFSIYNQKPI